MDFSTLLSGFDSLAIAVASFIVALSVIVAIHEYGHYIVGRWSGIHAEVFSIGFGPVLWSRTDRRGTRWQVAALPLGGYVKFLGDANPASVGADSSVPKARNTMLGAPLWARAATVAAGPIFNFILAALIFWALVLVDGKPTAPLTLASVPDLPERYEMALQPGDELVSIAGLPAGTAEDFAAALVNPALPDTAALDYRIRRDGSDMSVTGPYPMLPLVQSVAPRSAALKAGLKTGDVILSVGDSPIHSFAGLKAGVEGSAGAPVAIEVWRAGEVSEHLLTPRLQEIPLPEGGYQTRYLIGVTVGAFLDPQTEVPGVFAAGKLAVAQLWAVLSRSLTGLWDVITGKISSCNISSFYGIAETTGVAVQHGLVPFLWLLGLLSAGIGVLNLFPIPVLDGGHLVFHAYEALTGRPPSERALNVLMTIGFALLMTLMVFALFNDAIFCR